MTIRDIVQIELKGTAVPVATSPKPTPQQAERTRGKFVPGRSVPSKRIKVMHRRAKPNMSLKRWALALSNAVDSNTVQEWFRNKSND